MVYSLGVDITWTTNQLVAWNLRAARKLRGLSQREAAERLEPHMGVKWTPQTFSGVEVGSLKPDAVQEGRVRQFTADELMAFSLAFDLPLFWFFLPPDPQELAEFLGGDAEVTFKSSVAAKSLLNGRELLRSFLGEPELAVQGRLSKLFETLPEGALLEHDLRRAQVATAEVRGLVQREIPNLLDLAERLRVAAQLLVDASVRVGATEELKPAEKRALEWAAEQGLIDSIPESLDKEMSLKLGAESFTGPKDEHESRSER
jgi:hypothetical protein